MNGKNITITVEEYEELKGMQVCLKKCLDEALDEMKKGVKDFGKLADQIKALRVQNNSFKHAEHETRQILGKVLGYAWFRDSDPSATEAEGVDLAGKSTASLAKEAASEIERLRRME